MISYHKYTTSFDLGQSSLRTNSYNYENLNFPQEQGRMGRAFSNALLNVWSRPIMAGFPDVHIR